MQYVDLCRDNDFSHSKRLKLKLHSHKIRTYVSHTVLYELIFMIRKVIDVTLHLEYRRQYSTAYLSFYITPAFKQTHQVRQSVRSDAICFDLCLSLSMLHCLTKFLLDHVIRCIGRFAVVFKTSCARIKFAVLPGTLEFEDCEQKLLGYSLYPLDEHNRIVHVV